MGFADTDGVPLSHAVYHEGDETEWGREMAAFLTGLGGPSALAPGFSELSAGKWNRLVKRLDEIPNPTVPASPAK